MMKPKKMWAVVPDQKVVIILYIAQNRRQARECIERLRYYQGFKAHNYKILKISVTEGWK